MPFKSQNIRLSQEQDRRVKLTDEQKEVIKELYQTGGYSYSQLAKMYKVSKSLICLTCNEQRALKVKQRIKEHWQDYSDRKELTKAAKNLRRYKQDLFLKGELKENE